jgi:chorismate lyase/3-hydroxybenzoate synthase
VTVSSAKIETLTAADPLVFRRLRTNGAASTVSSLGGRRVGHSTDAVHATVLAPVLAASEDVFDEWACSAAVTQGRHGCVSFTTDGQWLHGLARIDDESLGLQAASRQAYVDIFEVLANSECPHLLRLWNYFARINEPGDARDGAENVERYRLFNAGRQEAFIKAQRSAFEGAPAACALGVESGPLMVYFLAGRIAPIALENPRQVSAYRYPKTYGVCPPTFSRAALAEIARDRTALLVSGTASIVGHVTMHVGDVRRQTEEAMLNIAAIRDSASAVGGIRFEAGALTYTVYVRHPADLPEVRSVFERVVGAASAAAKTALYLRADICRADLLVEIEAHGSICTGSVS